MRNLFDREHIKRSIRKFTNHDLGYVDEVHIGNHSVSKISTDLFKPVRKLKSSFKKIERCHILNALGNGIPSIFVKHTQLGDRVLTIVSSLRDLQVQLLSTFVSENLKESTESIRLHIRSRVRRSIGYGMMAARNAF